MLQAHPAHAQTIMKPWFLGQVLRLLDPDHPANVQIIAMKLRELEVLSHLGVKASLAQAGATTLWSSRCVTAQLIGFSWRQSGRCGPLRTARQPTTAPLCRLGLSRPLCAS